MVHQVATANAVTHVFVACSNELSGVGWWNKLQADSWNAKGNLKVKKLHNHRNEQLDAIIVQDPGSLDFCPVPMTAVGLPTSDFPFPPYTQYSNKHSTPRCLKLLSMERRRGGEPMAFPRAAS